LLFIIAKGLSYLGPYHILEISLFFSCPPQKEQYLYHGLSHLYLPDDARVLVHSNMGAVAIAMLLILAFSLCSPGCLRVLGPLVFSWMFCGSRIVGKLLAIANNYHTDLVLELDKRFLIGLTINSLEQTAQ